MTLWHEPGWCWHRGVVSRHWTRLISDTHVQVGSANVTKSTKSSTIECPVIWPPLYAPLITPQHGLMIHCDVQIVIGRRKTRDYAQHFFSATNLLKSYGLDIVILSFIPALVEPLAKILSLVLMKATFVKHVPSTLHPQWFRLLSMHTNFCLRINLGTCSTNLWLFEWKKVKSLRVFVCERGAQHNKANPIWDNLMHILCWLNWHLLYNVTVQDLIQQQTTLYSNLIGNSLLFNLHHSIP